MLLYISLMVSLKPSLPLSLFYVTNHMYFLFFSLGYVVKNRYVTV